MANQLIDKPKIRVVMFVEIMLCAMFVDLSAMISLTESTHDKPKNYVQPSHLCLFRIISVALSQTKTKPLFYFAQFGTGLMRHTNIDVS